jgi:recombination protein RecT
METPLNPSKLPVYREPVRQKDGTSSLKRFNSAIINPQMQEYLTTVLGNKKEQFVNNMMAVVGNDPKLQGCTPQSLIYAAVKATALDLPLDPNLGFAYLIPYNNTKKFKETQMIAKTEKDTPQPVEVEVTMTLKEAQFQLGYRGFYQLAIRTGLFSTINVTDIRDGELGRKNLISGEIALNEIPNREEKPIVGYLSFFALKNGFSKMFYMSVEELKKHAETFSQTYSSKSSYTKSNSKWTTDFDAMARKTVLKLLLSKYAPLSVEMRGVEQLKEAIRSDQAVIDEQGNPDYVDAVPAEERAERLVEERKEEMRQEESSAPQLL